MVLLHGRLKNPRGLKPNSTMELSDEDIQKLDHLITELESNDDVQAVYTNAE